MARLKDKLRPHLRAGRGRSLAEVCARLAPILRGWAAYYRLAEVKASFEALDQWLRRKLRCLLWRQWKRWPTRVRQLHRRGLAIVRAVYSAMNGRGPWWNAGSLHMRQAVPNRWLQAQGLLSLLDESRRIATTS